MSNNLLALLAAIGAFAVFVTMASANSTTERFWNTPSRTWKVEKVLGVPSNDCKQSDFFQTPNFQSILAPRFSNVNYGPYIRTVLPPYSAFGVPQDPLNKECPSSSVTTVAGKMASARSAANNPRAGYSFGTKLTPINPRAGSEFSYANGNFNEVRDAIAQAAGGAIPTDTVMEGTPALSMGSDGDLMNPIVFDRYIYANRNSRLRSQGDKIRGDLPIAPNNGNWFTPNVHPNIDLEAGAINVIAGVDNSTSNQLANLIYNASGRADTTIGGVDMASAMTALNPAMQEISATSAGGGDLTIRAFP